MSLVLNVTKAFPNSSNKSFFIPTPLSITLNLTNFLSLENLITNFTCPFLFNYYFENLKEFYVKLIRDYLILHSS